MATSFREAVLERNPESLFVTRNFDVFPYCESKYSSNNTNILSRIVSSFADRLNERIKLPKYVVIVLDDDLLQHLGYFKFRISGLIGDWLQFLANKLMQLALDRKKCLPKKACKPTYPLFYWVALPQHRSFINNVLRSKYNATLNMLMKIHTNMRMIRLKEIWDFNSMHYTTEGDRLSLFGLSKYWESIDASLKFNIIKHEQFLKRQNLQNAPLSLQGPTANSGKCKDEDKKFLNRVNTTHFPSRQMTEDNFHWHNKTFSMGKACGWKIPTPKARKRINFN